MKYAKQAREKYFEDEADVSGSASADENDESQELSGDFINDSQYTNDDDAGGYTQQAMYYRLNRLDDQSPDLLNFKFRGAEKGLPLIEKLLKKQKVDIPESLLDGSFISYDNDSVADDNNHDTSPNIYNVYSDDVSSAKKIGIDDGSKKITVSRVHKMPLTSSSPVNENIAYDTTNTQLKSNNQIRVINQPLPYSRQPLSYMNDNSINHNSSGNKASIKFKAPLESQLTDIKATNFASSYDLDSIYEDDDW